MIIVYKNNLSKEVKDKIMRKILGELTLYADYIEDFNGNILKSKNKMFLLNK